MWCSYRLICSWKQSCWWLRSSKQACVILKFCLQETQTRASKRTDKLLLRNTSIVHLVLLEFRWAEKYLLILRRNLRINQQKGIFLTWKTYDERQISLIGYPCFNRKIMEVTNLRTQRKMWPRSDRILKTSSFGTLMLYSAEDSENISSRSCSTVSSRKQSLREEQIPNLLGRVSGFSDWGLVYYCITNYNLGKLVRKTHQCFQTPNKGSSNSKELHSRSLYLTLLMLLFWPSHYFCVVELHPKHHLSAQNSGKVDTAHFWE